jgi:hypothetical protein
MMDMQQCNDDRYKNFRGQRAQIFVQFFSSLFEDIPTTRGLVVTYGCQNIVDGAKSGRLLMVKLDKMPQFHTAANILHKPKDKSVD